MTAAFPLITDVALADHGQGGNELLRLAQARGQNGVQLGPLDPASRSLSRMTISVPAVGLSLPDLSTRVEISRGEYLRVECPITAGVNASVQLEGTWDDARLRITQWEFEVLTLDPSTAAEFAASTVLAALALGEPAELTLHPPTIRLDLANDEPVDVLSAVLKRRRLLEWLMTVERAVGASIRLPDEISAAQGAQLSLIYNAITRRTATIPLAIWVIRTPIPREDVTTWEERVRIYKSGTPGTHDIPLPGESFDVFGTNVELGAGRMALYDTVIEAVEDIPDLTNEETVWKRVTLRSLSGVARLDFPNAPQLPEEPWTPTLRHLLEIGSRLSEVAAYRYLRLAEETFRGLSEPVKNRLTEGVDFGPGAFDERESESA